MSPRYSVAMTEAVERQATDHLLRADGQEDICFALWRRSTGATRTTALIQRIVAPVEGDRRVHGNASFEAQYFQRALEIAAREGAGVALLHSHPFGRGWQGMSEDDVRAEQNNAGAVYGATKHPFIGLTLAGDRTWSARFWPRTAPRTYERHDCASVRLVGNRLRVCFNEALIPQPPETQEQLRTVSAWGEQSQADLTRLRIGIIGLGSVGGIVAEFAARTGFVEITVMDFDAVERHNLDRLIFADSSHVGQSKVEVLADRLRRIATAQTVIVHEVPHAVYEQSGLAAALDCDLLMACVDRPWGRHVLNSVAYAHLIPVVDGGIAVRTNRLGKLAAADWRAHTATVGRQCLQCLGQYLGSDVCLEQQGMLDDPVYIRGLPRDHHLKMRENVFAFSLGCASLQNLQALALTVAPLGLTNPGAQLYHFVGGFMEPAAHPSCHGDCPFLEYTGLGDASPIPKPIADISRVYQVPTPVPGPSFARLKWWQHARNFFRSIFR